MRRTFTVFFVAIGSLLPAACADLVGFPDVPDIADATAASTDASPMPDVTQGPGESSMMGGEAGPDGGVAALVCDGGPTVMACDSGCVDLASSAQNCRACGHDCGEGSSCVMGVCQPVQLYSGNLTDFAVDGTGLYFGWNQVISSCPLTGCAFSPKPVAQGVYDIGVHLARGYLAVSIPDQYDDSYLYICPNTGCNASNEFEVAYYAGPSGFEYRTVVSSPNAFFWSQLVSVTGDYVESCAPASDGGCTVLQSGDAGVGLPGETYQPRVLAATDSFVYFDEVDSDGGSHLSSCPSGLTNCAPTRVNDYAPAQAAALGSDVYFVTGQNTMFENAKIVKCPATGCSTGPAEVVTLPGFNETWQVAADDGGLYFTNGTTIQVCQAPDCQGVPADVAVGQSHAGWLRPFGGFLYWATSDDAGVANAIWRVAEPAP